MSTLGARGIVPAPIARLPWEMLIPLVLLTRRRDVMGALVNRRVTTAAAWGVTAVIVSLNAFLLVGLAR